MSVSSPWTSSAGIPDDTARGFFSLMAAEVLESRRLMEAKGLPLSNAVDHVVWSQN
jgi:hypothetical protein